MVSGNMLPNTVTSYQYKVKRENPEYKIIEFTTYQYPPITSRSCASCARGIPYILYINHQSPVTSRSCASCARGIPYILYINHQSPAKAGNLRYPPRPVKPGYDHGCI